jgi:hypothetical protein
MRSLRTLSDTAPPWWSDALYYATVVVFVAGVVSNDANLVVAGGAPTVLLNGLCGLMALIVERRYGVRVYISGRRYVFSSSSAL